MKETLWKPFRRGDLWAVFALALVLRLALFAASNNEMGTHKIMDACFDCSLYFDEGRAIATGSPMHFENSLFYFGPGYPLFLALNYLLFGGRIVLFVLVNIMISSISCLFVYRLARMLLGSYPAAIAAALLAALSYTSITLSCYLMSDTLYFHVYISSLILYLEALRDHSWKKGILAGILTGLAILIRPIGQFWPLVMMIIAVIYYWPHLASSPVDRRTVRAIAATAVVAIAVPLVMATAWMARNYRVNGVFTMSIAQGNGPGNLGAMTLERLTGRPAGEVTKGWIDQYLAATGKKRATLGETCAVEKTQGWHIIDSLPWEAVKTYSAVMWENLNFISVLHRQLVPEYGNFTLPIEYGIMNSWMKYAYLIASMLGLVILIGKRQFFAAMVLAGVFFYYASMLGFYRWQYSRHFLPGQIAGSILIACSMVTIVQAISASARSLSGRIQLRLSTPVNHSHPNYHRLMFSHGRFRGLTAENRSDQPVHSLHRLYYQKRDNNRPGDLPRIKKS